MCMSRYQFYSCSAWLKRTIMEYSNVPASTSPAKTSASFRHEMHILKEFLVLLWFHLATILGINSRLPLISFGREMHRLKENLVLSRFHLANILWHSFQAFSYFFRTRDGFYLTNNKRKITESGLPWLQATVIVLSFYQDTAKNIKEPLRRVSLVHQSPSINFHRKSTSRAASLFSSSPHHHHH